MIVGTSGFGQLKADFNIEKTSACGSLQTKFYDQSSGGSVVSYLWELGVASSVLQNPGATYTEPGKYTICLTVKDAYGNEDKLCKTDAIEVFPSPVVDFASDRNEGCAPVEVVFTDLSTSANGSITSWQWDIGGSANVISTSDPNKVISSKYTSPGEFTATLSVVDEKGCRASVSKQNFIDVNSINPPNIDVEIVESCQLPWTVQFSNLDVDESVEYLWDFGNGQTYQGDNPPLTTYSDQGVYDLTVYMRNGSCRDTFLLEEAINSSSKASIEVPDQTFCAELDIPFSYKSSISADSVMWLFGDGATSMMAEANHAYNTPGCYDVSLVFWYRGCVDTIRRPCVQVDSSLQVGYTIDNQFHCALPISVNANGTSAANGQWSWILDKKDTISSSSARFEFEKYGSHDLSVLFEADNGCVYQEDNIPVIIKKFEVDVPRRGYEGCGPLTVNLRDSLPSGQVAESHYWDIGDGLYTSYDERPTFTISDTGRYDLKLIVKNDIGCSDTVRISDYVRVGMRPEVDFTIDPLVSCKELDKVFTDLSSPFVDTWTWEHSDRETPFSQDKNPEYEFPDADNYDITLYVSHNGCANSITKKEYITIAVPDSEYGLVYNCEDPYTVEINNTSTGADEQKWSIQISDTDYFTSTDSLIDPITFPERGKYVISLWSKNDSTGCEDTTIDTIRIVDPIASYTLDTLRGCAPFTVDLQTIAQDADLYEYVVDASTIDTTDILFPTVTFTEGGVITGPTLMVTDIHECRDTFQFQDSVQVNKLTAAVDHNWTICIPGEEVFLDQSTATEANIISWEWRIGDTLHMDTMQNTSYLFDEEGVYDIYLKVEDDWGCQDSVLLEEVLVAVELKPDFTTDTLGCTFSPIQFKAVGANQNVESYLWEFGNGDTSVVKNPQHTFQTEGIYSVCLTMFDYRGCSKTVCKDSIILIQDPVASFEGDSLFSTCPPMLTNFTNLSTNTIGVEWDFGDDSGLSFNESPGHVYTQSGRFDVTMVAIMTDKCRDTLTLEDYIIVEGPQARFNTVYTPSCIPQHIAMDASSDDVYQFIWDYGDGVLDSVPGLVDNAMTTYMYDRPGSYAPKLLVADDKGCTRSFSGELIRVDEVMLDFEVMDSIYCGLPNNIGLINGSVSTTAEVEYVWELTGADTITNVEVSPSFDIEMPGVYDLRLISTYGGCKDTLIKSSIFEVGELPVADFELSNDLLCENIEISTINNTTLGYGSVSDWKWTVGDSTYTDENISLVIDNLEPQVLRLEVTTNLGCQDTLSKTYEVLPSMVADAGPDQIICLDEVAQLAGSIEPLLDGGSYSWSTDDQLSCTDCLSPVADIDGTTTFILTAIHPAGCVSIDSVEIALAPVARPALSLVADSIICEGASTTINVTNFDASYTYIWNPFIDGLSCYKDCASITASPSKPTTYPVVVINEYGCKTFDSVYIDVESSYEGLVPKRKAVCEDGSLELSVLDGMDPQWEVDAELSCSDCDPVLASPSGSRYYYLGVSSPLGCRYRDSVYVEVIPKGLADAGDGQTICVGETITIEGVGQGRANWSPEGVFSQVDSFVTMATLDETTTLVLTMTDDNCVQKDSVVIEVIQKANLIAYGDTICYGDEAMLYAEGTIDSIIWLSEKRGFSSDREQMVKPETSTLYDVVGFYRSCETDTASAYVKVHDSIDYRLPESTYVIYTNDDIDLDPIYDASRNYVYTWTPAIALSCDDCPAPEIRGLTETTNYTVQVMDMDSNCPEEHMINVRYVPICNEGVVVFPNIFRPTSSGPNAAFGPITENKDEFISMTVYDRWGEKVHSTEDPDDHWDGRINGELAESGVYVYFVELICPETNKMYQIKGDVTLIY